jgi:hypothetical protein
MTQQEWWQMSRIREASWRMPFEQEAVVGVVGTSPRAWLQVADVVVGEHRTRRQARRWIASVQRDYPRCILAVARQRRGRWCMVGFPARNIVMRGGTFDLLVAEQIGRVIYHLWLLRRSQL